jgi:hypothetical protein
MLDSGIAVYLAIQPSGRWSGRPSERDPAAGGFHPIWAMAAPTLMR